MRDTYIPASETYVYESASEVKGFFSLHDDIPAWVVESLDHEAANKPYKSDTASGAH